MRLDALARPRRTVAVLGAVALTAATAALGSAPAHAVPTAANTLVVHADQPFRPVTHVASGALYGLDTATVPADSLVEALHPNTFVQMAPGGSQLPNGEPAPGGDALAVAPEAARAGAQVVVRMPDWYPNFPYKWVSWDDWLSAVDQQVAAVQASGDHNIVAYELWNEPDWTWNTAAAGSFEDAWTRTYREVRAKDPSTPIQGPSYSDNISGMQGFLENAVATGTVPDIISWHELESSSKIAGDIAQVTAIEKSLGITPRPIAIEEYGTTSEVGVPGALVGYIAKFERYGVDNAELAFWNHYGTLGDTLTDTGGAPNGAYWLYKWYGGMTGSMVTTVPPAQTGIDGAASVNKAGNQLDVIFGGGSGSSAVTVDGLDKLHLGNKVHVKLEYTPSEGRTTAVSGPITISQADYPVRNGSITVPVATNAADGYHLVITTGGPKPSLDGTYRVTNANSGLALDTAEEGTATGAAAVQDPVSASAATQDWQLVSAGRGLYRIVDRGSGLDLGISGGSTANGAPALVRSEDGAPDQLWQLIPASGGSYKIANYGSGLVLGVADVSTASGAPVIQWADGLATSACDAASARGSGAPGLQGTAIKLCGSNEYVSLPTGIVSGLHDFTVSAWVDPARNSTWSRLFDFGTGPSASMFLTVNDGGAVRFAITDSGSGGEQRIDGTGTLPLNTWSLVTVTVSGSTGTLYVDGKPVGSNTGMTLHPADLGSTTQNWIGRSQYADPYLDAQVDDFAIYSRALSSAQVAALAAGQQASGDVADYRFDEPGGPTATDSSGRGEDATVVSDPQATGSDGSPDHLWTLTPVTG